MFVFGGPEADAARVRGLAAIAGVGGGLLVAREQRREEGPGRRAHAAVLAYVGWALLGAWIGQTISLFFALGVSVDSLSGLAKLAVVVVVVLGGTASGLLVARKRQAS